MYYRSLFSRDPFTELDRLQRELKRAFHPDSSIRGLTQGFPALNISGTPQAVDICAFAPGVDPSALEVHLEKGTLTIAGERKLDTLPENATLHIDERFSGRFRRVVSLPDDVSPEGIEAHYREGVLHIHIPRREEAQLRRISVQ